jgi:hypothetical protein
MDVRTAPHSPFLAALDSQTEGSEGWLVCRARLLAVHLVDRWTEVALVAQVADAVREMRAVAGVG